MRAGPLFRLTVGERVFTRLANKVNEGSLVKSREENPFYLPPLNWKGDLCKTREFNETLKFRDRFFGWTVNSSTSSTAIPVF